MVASFFSCFREKKYKKHFDLGVFDWIFVVVIQFL